MRVKVAFTVKGKITNALQFNEECRKHLGHSPEFSNDDYVWRNWVEYNPDKNETTVFVNCWQRGEKLCRVLKKFGKILKIQMI